jgi:hypothetical protein
MLEITARLVGVALLLGAQSAAAATLSFTGTLTLEFPAFWTPVTFSGSGVATGSGAGFTLPGNAFSGTTTATTHTQRAAPITGNQHVLSGHGPGSFAGSPLGGSMPLAGRIDGLGYGGLKLFEIRLARTGGAVGGGGSYSYNQPSIGLIFQIQAEPWTTGTVSWVFTTPLFTPTPRTFVRSGFDARGLDGVGAARLVTRFVLTAGAQPPAAGFATLDLSFVPESPGAAGVALGAAALAATQMGRSRRRRA